MNRLLFTLIILISISITLTAQSEIKFNTISKDINKVTFVDSTHFVIIDKNVIKKFFYKNSQAVDSISISGNDINAFCYDKTKKQTYTIDSNNILYVEKNKVIDKVVDLDIKYEIDDVFLINSNKIGFSLNSNRLVILNLLSKELNNITLLAPITAWETIEDYLFIIDLKGNLYKINTSTCVVENTLNISKFGAVNMNLNPSNNLIDIYIIDGKIQSYNYNNNMIYCSFSYKSPFSFGETYSNNLIIRADELGKIRIETSFSSYKYNVNKRVLDFEFIPMLFKRKRLDFVVSVKNRGIFFVPASSLKLK